MSRVVHLPPPSVPSADGILAGGWWHDAPDGQRIICDLCPRACAMKPGDRGFCFVRQNVAGEMQLTTYGRSTGFCIDPIEKKPLNHFFPGTSVLSFGTAGCNLGCKFCQNWDISKSREVERLSELATPAAIAAAAQHMHCRSVAFTYNDPVIWAEYAIDTAKACHAVGVKTVAVTAGYITPAARGPFYEHMDAANVDLKAFTEDFYHHITYSHLQPVLDTLEWLKKETNVWFEITNLLIPNANDSLDEIRQMSDWILQHVGDEVPIHFTAFHPDFRMRDRPNTPHETLLAAQEAAQRVGLKYTYVGNVNDVVHQSTYCARCKKVLIERDWYALGQYHLRGNHCGHCGERIAGHFDTVPGSWGRKRVPVQISHYLTAPSPATAAPSITAPTPQIVTLSLKDSSMQTPPAATQVTPAAQNADRPVLTAEQQTRIEHAANEIVASEILGRRARLPDPTLAGSASIPVMGSFVTLKRQERLRACCGFLGQPMTLIEALTNAARRTATDDQRLPPISSTELPYLDLDVSLLYGFQPVQARGANRIAAVTVGRHGLTIRRGNASGLLLPVVPVEQQWDSETFLRQVCRKAGLPTTAWQEEDTQLVTFEAFCVGGPFDTSVLSSDDVKSPVRFSSAEIQQLAEHCRYNVIALTEGATPNYYLSGVSDGTVAGVTLTLHLPKRNEPIHLSQLSLRPGVPLQTTAFQLCESAAGQLRGAQISRVDRTSLRVGVTVLYDSAMHGTAGTPDLRGIEAPQRSLVLMEGNKSAWVFDPSESAENLLATAVSVAQVTSPEAASLFSLATQSSEPRVVFSTVPRAVAGSETRAPAVAGTFYPADAHELANWVTEMLAATPRRHQRWPAVMVPHAGLRYSGKIAAEVFNQLEIPSTVIIIGPKHTRLGVEWAVAPHLFWSVPGATLASDLELAKKLVAAIPGLQLDAAAHQQEHGIEVELPFLARLAPTARVVGITIGGGGLDRCRQFAAGLANVIRTLPEPPLLVISSDMNHYAPDRENRRLDEIALQAMEQRDPALLLSTVSEHNISMCGVLPAVIVMETLKQLGGLQTCERVAYATSADASGDKSRVVGYAGMLLR